MQPLGPVVLIHSSGFRSGSEVDEQVISLTLVFEIMTLKTVSHSPALCWGQIREHHRQKKQEVVISQSTWRLSQPLKQGHCCASLLPLTPE